jgi:hypothetical protein
MTAELQVVWTSSPLDFLKQTSASAQDHNNPNQLTNLFHADIISLEQNFICSPEVIFIEQIIDQIT